MTPKQKWWEEECEKHVRTESQSWNGNSDTDFYRREGFLAACNLWEERTLKATQGFSLEATETKARHDYNLALQSVREEILGVE